jgi:hypothetical protein
MPRSTITNTLHAALCVALTACTATVTRDDATREADTPRGDHGLTLTLDDDDELPSVPALTEHEVSALREGAAEYERPVVREDGTLTKAGDPLAATDSSGTPALHYAMIEIRDQRHAALLAELGLHVDAQPLFAEELRDDPDAKSGILREPATDGRGVFAFVVLPAAVYEAMVELAAAGTPAFPTVLLRAVPDKDARDDEATLSRLSFTALEAQGFEWNTLDETRAPEPTDKEEAAVEAEWFASMAGLVELAQVELTQARKTFVPYALGTPVSIRVLPRETDNLFRVANEPGSSNVMVRAWGPSRGSAVDLRGVPVVAKPDQGLARRGLIGEQNRVQLELRENRDYTLCIELDSPSAKIMTAPPFSTQACVGGVVDASDAQIDLSVRNTRLGWLIQAIEGRQWLEQIAGHQIHKAKVLTGTVANIISAKTTTGDEKAYAPCAGLFGAKWVQLVPGLLGSLGTVADVFFNIDVVMPGPSAEEFNRSRAGFTHEYGHVAMCSMMRRSTGVGPIGRMRFEWAWQDLILHTAGARGIEDESAWLAEGFADFFMSQVAGAVGYHYPDTDPLHLIHNAGNVRSCDAAFDDCMETNDVLPDLFDDSLPTQDYGLFNAGISGWLGILHDMVDGHPRASLAARPNNGAAWIAVRDEDDDVRARLAGAFDAPRQNDEAVRLAGGGLVTMFGDWSLRAGPLPTLRAKNMFHAAAAAMQAQDVADAQICRLFELHLDDLSCLAPAPDADMPLDPNAIDDLEGDLFAPVGLRCTFPEDEGVMRCRWEDLSLDGVGYDVRIVDDETNAVLFEGPEAYAIFATADYDTPAADVVRVEVSTRVADGRIGDPAVATVGVPQSPPEFGCGNGIVEPLLGEECEGLGQPGGGHTCPQGCEAVRLCIDCEIVPDCECV